MPAKRRRKTRINSRKKSPVSLKNSSSNNFQYTVQLTKQAYEEREETCTYKDYVALITLAAFNQHEIRHLQIDKYKNNFQMELELLKRWNKLPLEERNKYENEAIDNDIFHQIAYTRMKNEEMMIIDSQSSATQYLNVRKELEIQWNDLPEEERIVHKRVVTNRDIEMRRFSPGQ